MHASQMPLTDGPHRTGNGGGIKQWLIRHVDDYLAAAGVQVGGPSPWDIQVHDDRFYGRIFRDGSLGLGESYMDGWWDTERLDEFVFRIQSAGLEPHFRRIDLLWLWIADLLLSRQNRNRASDVAARHYDLGNDLFAAMLDATMQYTCAYWQNAKDLQAAQAAKLELIAKKLSLKPGMSVLELGGGFGGLALHLAAHYGCRVVSYNNSREQVEFAVQRCRGLSVQNIYGDYRQALEQTEPFDRVVSVGLCEHVGHKNYRSFFGLIHRLLRPQGLCLLHTIGGNASYRETDPWIDKYVFPNGMVPSVAQLGVAAEQMWVIEDWHNFGPDYDPTLMAWWQNFDRAWPRLQQQYGDRFYRMWKYYLLGCAGTFRARKLQLWQLVLSKGDIPFYTPVR
jgi:cyclopropane-fatty-acyl-phospholipid synthase